MKKLVFLFLCVGLAFLPSILMAQTPQEERRVEEEKRQSLLPTREPVFEARKSTPQPSEPLDYFIELLSRKVAFCSDACKALVILMGVEDQHRDLASQLAFLKQKDIIPREIASEFDPHKPLRKGVAAYMFCKALGIKGGLGLRLFGRSQRYALKELIFEGIMPVGYVNDIVTGKELVLILTEAANYISERR